MLEYLLLSLALLCKDPAPRRLMAVPDAEPPAPPQLAALHVDGLPPVQPRDQQLPPEVKYRRKAWVTEFEPIGFTSTSFDPIDGTQEAW